MLLYPYASRLHLHIRINVLLLQMVVNWKLDRVSTRDFKTYLTHFSEVDFVPACYVSDGVGQAAVADVLLNLFCVLRHFSDLDRVVWAIAWYEIGGLSCLIELCL